MTRIMIWTILAGLMLSAGCILPQKSAVDHYVSAQALSEKGNTAAALAELKAAVKADPTLSVAHAAAGDIYRRQGDYEMAKQSYEAACQTNRFAFLPHYHLGVVYQALSDAATSADKVREYLEQAVNVYVRAITIRPNDFDANLNLSACYFQLGKFDLAEQYCKVAIEQNNGSAVAHSNLGTIYDYQGRLYDAVREYRTSLEIDVHQGPILLNLGATYMRQGKLKQAAHTFELATAELPNDAAAWEQLGACQYHLDDLDKAMEAYEKALTCNSSSAAAQRGIGVIHMTRYVRDRSRLDLRDLAIRSWDKSLELNPAQPDLRRLVDKYRPTPASANATIR